MSKNIIPALASILSLMIFLCVMIICTDIYLHHRIKNAETRVIINHGSSLNSICRNLNKAKLIDSPKLFCVITRIYTKNKPLIKAGEYYFPANSSLFSIMRKLLSGDVVMRKITIPEGFTNYQIVTLLNNSYGLFGNITPRDYQEGTLLPETYFYSYGDSKSRLLQQMNKRMWRGVDELWNKRLVDPSLISSKSEALTLASIVERESAKPDERKIIASVYLNRLKRGIKLQADPTTIYAVSDGRGKLDRPLTKSDIAFKSSINTYYIKGLPTTAISNPSLESVAAVLYPTPNNYIYFVADGYGGHIFAKTLAEHNKNVASYRQIMKQRL